MIRHYEVSRIVKQIADIITRLKSDGYKSASFRRRRTDDYRRKLLRLSRKVDDGRRGKVIRVSPVPYKLASRQFHHA
jgi:hypothetical protein